MDAVLQAAQQRLRPILMTSLATSFGALPIALSLGAASTSRVPLGIVIVGGIIFSLVLTLFVIPAMYSFLAPKGEHKHNDKEEEIKVNSKEKKDDNTSGEEKSLDK
jgi:Cu/Ag efflux pump CusA